MAFASHLFAPLAAPLPLDGALHFGSDGGGNGPSLASRHPFSQHLQGIGVSLPGFANTCTDSPPPHRPGPSAGDRQNPPKYQLTYLPLFKKNQKNYKNIIGKLVLLVFGRIFPISGQPPRGGVAGANPCKCSQNRRGTYPFRGSVAKSKTTGYNEDRGARVCGPKGASFRESKTGQGPTHSVEALGKKNTRCNAERGARVCGRSPVFIRDRRRPWICFKGVNGR